MAEPLSQSSERTLEMPRKGMRSSPVYEFVDSIAGLLGCSSHERNLGVAHTKAECGSI